MHPDTALLPPLPLSGRVSDLLAIGDAVDRLRRGRGSVLFVTGEWGVGKSRLLSDLAAYRRDAGWQTAEGRAYAVETDIPFAILSDALVPLVDRLGTNALEVLSRGSASSLARLFPSLLGEPEHLGHGEPHSSVQLFWSLATVLRALADRAPLLIVLDDLHWSDPTSLELVHFLARHLCQAPVAIVGAINEDERHTHPTLSGVQHSLTTQGLAESYRLGPLTVEAVEELVRGAFGVGGAVSAAFGQQLHQRTAGNPLLIEATLATLVEQGTLRLEDGTWVGWETPIGAAPAPVREAVLHRIERLSPEVRTTAEEIAVIGTKAPHDVLRAVSDLDERELAGSLDSLVRYGFIHEEGGSGRCPVYDFRHPLARDVVLREIGGARRALLHRRIGNALEARYGDDAALHAEELALHFTRGEMGEPSARTLPYLAVAGRRALDRGADREAAQYLRLALARVGDSAGERVRLMEDLGRALRRLGEVRAALDLWETGAEEAQRAGDRSAAAVLRYRIGLAHYFLGELAAALEAYAAGLADAREAVDPRVVARVLIARGTCLQGLGRVREAERDFREALETARRVGNDGLLARAHRALLLFHTWSGPPEAARTHGRESIARAEAAAEPALACTCHWAVAVLEGLSGNAADCVRHVEIARDLADDVNSPILDLAVAEVQVEYAFGCGDWDTATAVGERAIALCRSLGQQALLPRLLVWTGLVHLGRDAGDRAHRYLNEAWVRSGAGSFDPSRDVHAVVPAHIGLATWHLALGEVDEAVRLARAGLEIVDRTGYRRWAAHRLLPVLAEAYLIARDLEGARGVGRRIRQEAEELDDPLARAWADACDALSHWLSGAGAEAAHALRVAAEELEAIPFLPDALRLRRRLAACLFDCGDRDSAIRELRRVHDGFVKLRAERELTKTRRALYEAGSRPPTRPSRPGAHGLTGREWDVLDRVSARRTNKAIARELGISPRTVERHLTNIFRKLGLTSRAELADVGRTLPREHA